MLNFKDETLGIKVASFSSEVTNLNVLAADEVKAQVNGLIDEGNRSIIIDFSNIKFIDSSGFGALVTVYNHAQNANCKLIMCNFSKQAQALLAVTKLNQVFSIYPNLEMAVESFS